MVETIDPKEVAIVCQCDNNTQFLREVELLFKSLNRFGGQLANIQKFVLIHGEISENDIKKFSNLGITVEYVEPIDKRDVFATKIRNLQIKNIDSIKHIISLDVDILVAKDFSAYLDGEHICAKPADMTLLSIKDWEYLLKFFDLEMPKRRVRTHFDLRESIPYFNTGVILIPKKYSVTLEETWKFYVKKLLDSYYLFPESIRKHSHFNNQFAFSLALIDTKIPWKDLPLEMNFPTHQQIHTSFRPEKINPYLLHHHHRYSQEGYLLPSFYNKINRVLEIMNKVIITKEEQ